MSSKPRIPSLTVPRTDKPFFGGTATSVLAHGTLLILVVFGSDQASERLLKTAGGPGPLGGGGGGGGERIEYLELPPYVPPSPAAAAQVVSEQRAVEVPVPRPQLRTITTETEPVRFLPPTERIAAPRLGSGPGTGGGPGAGTGSGGGTGTGEGTGLGLSISHGIIKGHGGRLWFESVEGEYTEAVVDLPASASNVWRHER